MKKIISILLLAVMLFSMYACNTPEDTTASPETKSPEYILKPSKEHTLYLYSNSKGIPADTKTPRYEGVKFDSISPKWYMKLSNGTVTEPVSSSEFEYNGIQSNITKSDTILGLELDFYYLKTRRTGEKDCDWYETTYNDKLVFAFYDCDTGKIAEYKRTGNCIDREFSSPVNSSSTEAEFIAYAKQILLELSGKSTEGYTVSVRTRNGQKMNWIDGFVSDPEEKEDPLDNVCYEISFSQTIDGVECYDKMTVYVTNVGELIELKAMADAAKYEPFKDLKIDREQLERTMLQQAPSVTNAFHVERYISELVLVAQGNELWAKGAVTQRWQAEGGMNLSGMTEYVVKLAEYEIAE